MSGQLKTIVRLIERSKDVGDGWRNVSRPLMPLITGFADQTLIEWKSNEDGSGSVRLTEKGITVSPYLGSPS